MVQPEKKILKLGIPAGSLQEATAELFKKAGYNIHRTGRRLTLENISSQISSTCELFSMIQS